MRRTIFLTVTLLLGLVMSRAVAQNAQTVHDHTVTTPDNVIDGSQHPELIPDADAYRLYFVAISEMPNPTDEQKARQIAHLKKIELQDSDLQSTIIALEEFRVQYTNLIAQYNESAEAAQKAGVKPDIDTFLLQRDALVQATHERVKSVLTPDGLTRLDAHVQREKRGMKVAVKEAQ